MVYSDPAPPVAPYGVPLLLNVIASISFGAFPTLLIVPIWADATEAQKHRPAMREYTIF